jgi:hypothetical protein
VRRKIVILKTRSNKLIEEMKNKYKVVVTEEHKKNGVFPWNNSVGTEYTLFLDCHSLNIVIYFRFCLELVTFRLWMLEQRFSKAVIQKEKEMVTFIENMCNVRRNLEKDIQKKSRIKLVCYKFSI